MSETNPIKLIDLVLKILNKFKKLPKGLNQKAFLVF